MCSVCGQMLRPNQCTNTLTPPNMKAAFLLVSAALLAATTHAEDFVCPEPYGFYPNPNNCIKYYQCSDDVAIELVCELSEWMDCHLLSP